MHKSLQNKMLRKKYSHFVDTLPVQCTVSRPLPPSILSSRLVPSRTETCSFRDSSKPSGSETSCIQNHQLRNLRLRHLCWTSKSFQSLYWKESNSAHMFKCLLVLISICLGIRRNPRRFFKLSKKHRSKIKLYRN